MIRLHFALSILFLFCLGTASVGYGAALPKVLNYPGSTVPTLYFAENGETSQNALNRHFAYLFDTSDLKPFAQEIRLLMDGNSTHIGHGQQQNIAQNIPQSVQLKARLNILLLANAPGDLTGQTKRVEKFRSLLAGHDSPFKPQIFILPVSNIDALTASQQQDALKWINRNIGLLVAMGGDDIDTHLYDEPLIFSRNINSSRDATEQKILQSFINYGKGFVFGVCRGHQLISAIHGYKLIQDIVHERGDQIGHSDHWHKIQTLNTRYSFLKKATNTKELMVNSLHHQSVVYHKGGPLELAAQSEDGITEALEFKSGKGFTTQFHPEFMDNELGGNILKVATAKAVDLRAQCRNQFL